MFPAPTVVEALNECRIVLESARAEGYKFWKAEHLIAAAFQEMGSPRAQAVSAILGTLESDDWADPGHEHSEDWMSLIQRQIQLFTDGPGPGLVATEAERQFDTQRFLTIGALAVAAVEAFAVSKLAADLAKATQQIEAEGSVI